MTHCNNISANNTTYIPSKINGNFEQSFSPKKLTEEQILRLNFLLNKNFEITPFNSHYPKIEFTLSTIIEYIKNKSSQQVDWLQNIRLMRCSANHILTGLDYTNAYIECTVEREIFGYFKLMIEEFLCSLFKKEYKQQISDPKQRHIPEELLIDFEKTTHTKEFRNFFSSLYQMEISILDSSTVCNLGALKIRFVHEKTQKNDNSIDEFNFKVDLQKLTVNFNGSYDQYRKNLHLLTSREINLAACQATEQLCYALYRMSQGFELNNLEIIAKNAKLSLNEENSNLCSQIFCYIQSRQGSQEQLIAFLNALTILDCEPQFVTFMASVFSELSSLKDLILTDAKSTLNLIKGVFLYKWLKKDSRVPEAYFLNFAQGIVRPYIGYKHENTHYIYVSDLFEVASDFVEAWFVLEKQINKETLENIEIFFSRFNLTFSFNEISRDEIVSKFIEEFNYSSSALSLGKPNFLKQIYKHLPNLANDIFGETVASMPKFLLFKDRIVINKANPTLIQKEIPAPNQLKKIGDFLLTHKELIEKDGQYKKIIEARVLNWFKKLKESENISLKNIELLSNFINAPEFAFLQFSKSRTILIAIYSKLLHEGKAAYLFATAHFIKEAKSPLLAHLFISHQSLLEKLETELNECLVKINLESKTDPGEIFDYVNLLISRDIPFQPLLNKIIVAVNSLKDKEIVFKITDLALKKVNDHQIEFSQLKLLEPLNNKLRSLDYKKELNFLTQVANSSKEPAIKHQIEQTFLSRMSTELIKKSPSENLNLLASSFAELESIQKEHHAELSLLNKEIAAKKYDEIAYSIIKIAYSINKNLSENIIKLFSSKFKSEEHFVLFSKLIDDKLDSSEYASALALWEGNLIPLLTSNTWLLAIPIIIKLIDRIGALQEKEKLIPTIIKIFECNKLINESKEIKLSLQELLKSCLEKTNKAEYLLHLAIIKHLRNDWDEISEGLLLELFKKSKIKNEDIPKFIGFINSLFVEGNQKASNKLKYELLSIALQKNYKEIFLLLWKTMSDLHDSELNPIYKIMCNSSDLEILNLVKRMLQTNPNAHISLLQTWCKNCIRHNHKELFVAIPSILSNLNTKDNHTLSSLKFVTKSKLQHDLKGLECLFPIISDPHVSDQNRKIYLDILFETKNKELIFKYLLSDQSNLKTNFGYYLHSSLIRGGFVDKLTDFYEYLCKCNQLDKKEFRALLEETMIALYGKSLENKAKNQLESDKKLDQLLLNYLVSLQGNEQAEISLGLRIKFFDCLKNQLSTFKTETFPWRYKKQNQDVHYEWAFQRFLAPTHYNEIRDLITRKYIEQLENEQEGIGKLDNSLAVKFYFGIADKMLKFLPCYSKINNPFILDKFLDHFLEFVEDFRLIDITENEFDSVKVKIGQAFNSLRTNVFPTDRITQFINITESLARFYAKWLKNYSEVRFFLNNMLNISLASRESTNETTLMYLDWDYHLSRVLWLQTKNFTIIEKEQTPFFNLIYKNSPSERYQLFDLFFLNFQKFTNDLTLETKELEGFINHILQMLGLFLLKEKEFIAKVLKDNPSEECLDAIFGIISKVDRLVNSLGKEGGLKSMNIFDSICVKTWKKELCVKFPESKEKIELAEQKARKLI